MPFVSAVGPGGHVFGIGGPVIGIANDPQAPVTSLIASCCHTGSL